MRRVIIAVIKIYQMSISRLFVGSCRYYPSCSDYAIEALNKHGLLKGAKLAAWRLIRCNPLAKGGYDPIPQKQEQVN